MHDHYDILVIGTGAMGAATCYHAAKQGLTCLGMDQYDPPHDLGSHTGQTRILRQAYFEHPNYVPLLQKAYAHWAALEKDSGVKLLHQPGMIYLGEPGNLLLDGVKKSSARYKLGVTSLTKEEGQKRFPQLFFPAGIDTLFEEKAGFVQADQCINTLLDLAKKNGATLLTNTKVISWELRNDHVVVFTNNHTYRAKKLIITAGAYTRKLVPRLANKIEVTKQHLFWFEPKDEALFSVDQFACWNIQDPDYPGLFYGFPYFTKKEGVDTWGLKIAHHYPGEKVNYPERHLASSKEAMEKEELMIRSILSKYLPKAVGPLLHRSTCFYANSPDEHFVIDALPNTEGRVVVGAGFSGHGFKFVPMVGEALLELATKGFADAPIEFLSFERFNTTTNSE